VIISPFSQIRRLLDNSGAGCHQRGRVQVGEAQVRVDNKDPVTEQELGKYKVASTPMLFAAASELHNVGR
jgi:hypothetical protein